MAFANSAISDIIATTIQSRTGKIADNVTKNNALLARLKQRGNIKPFGGGNVILQELSFQANGNAGWYSGYDLLPIAAQDVISAAQYDIKQAACPVIVSGLDQLMNSGKEQIIDLLEARVNVAESSMANLIAQGLYSDGTGAGGKQIDGLAKQVIAVPTSGTVGGIDRATWTFWRNQTFDASTDGGAATTSVNIQSYFNRLWAKLVRGMDRPDLIVVDNNYWGLYMGSLQAIQRFSSADDAKLGFVSIKYMDADVVMDGGIGGFMPASTAYFLNTKYLHYRPHRDRDMVPLSPGQRYSVNQDAAVQILAWAGNLTSSGLQFQGIMVE
ncbi:MAG: phage major capsid protein [Desulfurellales bacterium]|nr:MAG: phage major capsid protein [Desulfurellales bacterium]